MRANNLFAAALAAFTMPFAGSARAVTCTDAVDAVPMFTSAECGDHWLNVTVDPTPTGFTASFSGDSGRNDSFATTMTMQVVGDACRHTFPLADGEALVVETRNFRSGAAWLTDRDGREELLGGSCLVNY